MDQVLRLKRRAPPPALPPGPRSRARGGMADTAALMEAAINDAVAFQLVSVTNESDLRHMIFEYEPLPDQEEEG